MSRIHRIRLSTLSLFVLAITLSACTGGEYRNAAEKLKLQIGQGDWEAAAKLAADTGKIDEAGKSKKLEWSLNHGLALIQTGKYQTAIKSFDNAEDLMKFDDLSGFAAKAGSGVGAVLVNDTVRDYAFNSYDAIMVNSYKGLAFMLSGDQDNARVEFNRAEERQRRAVERFAAEIKKDQERNDAEAKKNAKVNSTDTVNRANEDAGIKSQYADLDSKKAYAPFANPITSYMRGVFIMLTSGTGGEFEKAVQDFRRVREMVGENAVLDSDLAYATARAEGKSAEKRVWVIFENGQSPLLEEFKLKSVMFTGTGVINFNYAIPKISFQPSAYSKLLVGSEGQDAKSTELVSDFEAVVAREFKDRLPGIVTRAVLSAAYKTAIQVAGQAVAANSQSDNAQMLGLLMNIGGAILSATTTAADTRSWVELPKEFQAVSFAPPENGQLVIKTEAGVEIGKVAVPKDRNALIYVKIQKNGATPSIKSMVY